MKKLRLLITTDCDKNCKGCCNKDWDIDRFPILPLHGWSEILITGGEPMLYPLRLDNLLSRIRKVNPDAKKILYTAKMLDLNDNSGKEVLYHSIVNKLDGITLTLHNQKDADVFYMYHKNLMFILAKLGKTDISLRLNVFKGLKFFKNKSVVDTWQIKENIEWIDNCPLPKDEVFARYF